VTNDAAALREADFIVVAVPTPIDDAHQPDFGPLLGASESVGRNLKRGAIVVFESTVYPGATEEVCVPVIEAHSKMKWKRDFFVGYSPERINPGDKQHTLTKITKVVRATRPKRSSASPRSMAASSRRRVSRELDQSRRGCKGDREHAARSEHRADERAGADLSQHRHRHDGSARGRGHQVELLPFRPGLVGGHCIGVDPYYLTHKAERSATTRR
jgi:UDP-N-acetyl-D-galactosamine dehydrogenase